MKHKIQQVFRLIGTKTVYENLSFAMRAVGYSSKEIRKRIGRKIKISSGKKAHKVEIEYTDDRDLEALLKLIAGEDIFD